MPILFAISILALIALLWASVAIAHHIRRTRRTTDASEAMFLPEMVVPAAEQQEFFVNDLKSAGPEHASPVSSPTKMDPVPQTAAALQSVPLEPVAVPIAPPRKIAVSAFQVAGRIDRAYFKEDMGDLTDPMPAHPKFRHRAR